MTDQTAPAQTSDATAPSYSIGTRLAAWGVHAITMSGLVWASLATISLINGHIAMMWLWLAFALVIDGIDGTLARRAQVRKVIPWFDGSVLDNIIDYITWTFLPALFMYKFLPLGPKPVALTMMIVAVVSSVFCYANEGEKSLDNYFVGFPAAWNVAAVTMYVFELPATVNIIVTLVLAVLTLVPLHYTHPLRVERCRWANIAASVVWITATGILVATHNARPVWAVALFGLSAAWFMGTGILRTWRGR